MTDHCHADTLPTYARAAEMAAHRASLALPAAVSDVPPFRLHEEPVPEPDCPRVRFEDDDKRKLGPPFKTEDRPYLRKEQNAAGRTVYVAQVRKGGVRDVRVYLGRYAAREEALQACADFIATGDKPEPQKRGAKLGQVQRRRRTAPKAENRPRQRATMPTSMPLAASGTSAAAKEVPEPPRAKLSSAERLQLIKDAWRRTA